VGSRTYPAGALIATQFDDFMQGKRDFTVVYEPAPNSSLAAHPDPQSPDP
jgi:prolyl oligopeptidase